MLFNDLNAPESWTDDMIKSLLNLYLTLLPFNESLIQELLKEEEDVIVGPYDIGPIIGKNGWTIKGINERSGAFCKVNDNRIRISGSREAIDSAKKMIKEITDKNGKRIKPQK